ncbi:Ankyrin-2 [Actinoplanes sp. SE50]|uniref:ankyrin repeat domain-containing protein n=1 Tax=unclassified Actinoplanes TaxID=2626549 RepID=UPI00023EC9A7|nr:MULTISPECIES: ankyrin repeat domain-containing protein [unclassified Actinoplanes]AEV85385.1 Ankyrin-2 [Actinoplanes sp. SE50/110]ATO83780.1 Ankyrin-2 [Actinoplanes sp. SE50]SLM01188.1 ankyrin-like protein [Actinoplanes sp. SE50/110]
MDLGRRRDRDDYARRMAYASPGGMIARATAARLAGDWRAACAAAMVDVRFEPAAVRDRFGAAATAAIEDDLAGLAPDLLRRHLPVDTWGRWPSRARVVLSSRPEPFRERRFLARRRPRVPVLVATLPRDGLVARRVTLEVVDVHELSGVWVDLPAWAWHADAIEGRRWAYGASAARLPWHFADGTAYPQGTVTDGTDRAGEFERLLGPIDQDRRTEWYAAAGIAVPDPHRDAWIVQRLAGLQDRLPVAAAEARRLIERYPERTGGLLRAPQWLDVRLTAAPGGLFRAEPADRVAGEPGGGPAAFGVAAPRDAALLRWGMIGPDQLHPLVHEALFPGRVQHWQPIEHRPRRTFRVLCGGRWHPVEAAGASLRILHPDHPVTPNGCTAAVDRFRTAGAGTPKKVRRLRQRVFERIVHGDTDAVLADLAAGCDPLLRDQHGRTLLHYIANVEHERVLPVLLAAGLSLADRDYDGRTPLHVAALSADTGAMAALIAAGADENAFDGRGSTAAQVRRVGS